ncbi:hypothetical protein GPA09_34720, partial [Burkholderia pseudomallei]|nr:hypothetical protein [Burkholderia pseudomallei]
MKRRRAFSGADRGRLRRRTAESGRAAHWGRIDAGVPGPKRHGAKHPDCGETFGGNYAQRGRRERGRG